jgi:hypothetical protein
MMYWSSSGDPERVRWTIASTSALVSVIGLASAAVIAGFGDGEEGCET